MRGKEIQFIRKAGMKHAQWFNSDKLRNRKHPDKRNISVTHKNALNQQKTARLTCPFCSLIRVASTLESSSHILISSSSYILLCARFTLSNGFRRITASGPDGSNLFDGSIRPEKKGVNNF